LCPKNRARYTAYSQQEHETALKLVDRFFGEVTSIDDIRPLWPPRNL
jgi:hypothetical protein